MVFKGWAVELNGVVLTGSVEANYDSYVSSGWPANHTVMCCTLTGDGPPDISIPAYRTNDYEVVDRDGAFFGDDYYRPLSITVVAHVPGCNGGNPREMKSLLQEAWGRSCGMEYLTYWTSAVPGGDQRYDGPFIIAGRPRVFDVVAGLDGMYTVTMRFDALDQYVYIKSDTTDVDGFNRIELSPTTDTQCRSVDSCTDRCYTNETEDLGLGAVDINALGSDNSTELTFVGPLAAPIVVSNDTTGTAFVLTKSIPDGGVWTRDAVTGRVTTDAGEDVTSLASGVITVDPGINHIRFVSSGTSDTGSAVLGWRDGRVGI